MDHDDDSVRDKVVRLEVTVANVRDRMDRMEATSQADRSEMRQMIATGQDRVTADIRGLLDQLTLLREALAQRKGGLGAITWLVGILGASGVGEVIRILIGHH